MSWTWLTVLVVLMATSSLCQHGHPKPTHPSPPHHSTPKSCGADIVFVVDKSASVGSKINYALVKAYLAKLVDRYGIDSRSTRVGLVTYSTHVGKTIYLNAYYSSASLKSAILSLIYSGGQYRNTADALAYVRTTMLTSAAGARSDVYKVVIVITAGPSTDIHATKAEAYKLKSISGAKVIVLSIGSKVGRYELEYIASEPYDSNIVEVQSYISLYKVEHQLYDASCSGSYVCTQYKIAELLQRLTYLLAAKTAEQKHHIYHEIVVDLAKYDQYLAESLKYAYLKEGYYSPTAAAELFFYGLTVVIKLYPYVDQLKHHIQYVAAAKTELARAFYLNAPLIAKSIVRVFGKTLLTTSEKQSWSGCLGKVAEKVKLIAAEVKLSAICHVDEDTGIPGFPITGNIIFTQPLYGGTTVISVSLCGFNDTKKHGWHVHAVGNTDNQCAAAGPHFNPLNLQHGAPTDQYRHVGDLGNFQADLKGKIVEKFEDNVVSLQGDNNVIGRAVVIHRDEDDLGRGGAPDSLTTGNAGARIACCVIDSCLAVY